MKLHIAGIAGSGKTTLARSVSQRFDIPAYDLDFVVYDVERGERPREEIVRRIDEIRGRAGWVTEGAYHDVWLRPLLEDATAIAWLDVPLRSAMFRVLKRHVGAELAGNNLHPGWMRLVRFINYNRMTARRERDETRALLAPYGGRSRSANRRGTSRRSRRGL